MDTAARLEPAECAQVLADLGYAGLGGRPATAKAHAAALQAKGLAYFNGYFVADFLSGQVDLPPELTKAVDDLAGTGGTLWLAVNKVTLPLGLSLGPEYGDTVVVPQLRQLVTYARSKGVKISLYPHTGFWAARFETCVRVASKVDDPNLGVTFNLCHWLKVEGSERDPLPLIKEALPRLNFITINGADRDQGITTDLMGHPMNCLAWLASSPVIAAFGGMKAGQVVMLGSVTPPVWLDAPATITVTFDPLPPVTLRLG